MSDAYATLVHTAVAIRSLADALLAQLGTSVVPAELAATCEHPVAQRIQRAAFGTAGEHWTCGVCGYEHDDAGDVEALDGR